MPPDRTLTEKCFNKLLEVTKSRSFDDPRPVITYREMAEYLDVPERSPGVSVGNYLDKIYEDRIRNRPEVPDLTTLVINKNTGYGWYNSRGGPLKSKKIKPKSKKDRMIYDVELGRVYEYWGSKT